MKEQLSALIDGESNDIERERTLRALRENPEFLHTWERYHLVSTAMRRELDYVVSPDFANRVQARVMQEQPDVSHRFPSPRLLKLTAGVAIAASVATVAILNLSPLGNSSAPSVARSSSGSALMAKSQPLPPEKQRVLNPYLVHHAEFSSAFGVNSMGAYARVVGRDHVPAEANAPE